MATDDSPREVYKFTGMKDLGTRVDRIIVEGSTSNPERYVDLGGEIELTDKEAANLKRSGHKLTKKGESASSKDDDNGGDEPEEKGSTQTVASGAQAPASSPEKDKRPGSPGAGKN